MAGLYNEGSRHLQDSFDSRRLADRLEEVKVRDHIDAGDRAFIESLDMFFLATADADGRPTCSYKGGDPGFVRVLDERTLAFPGYDGNGMSCPSATCSSTPRSGCCSSASSAAAGCGWTAPRPSRSRTAARDLAGGEAGRARHRPRGVPQLPALHPPPRARRALPLRPPTRHTPVPDWKRTDWASDVLPEGDLPDPDRFTIVHRDEFERTGGWALARRSLGLSAFGMNIVDIPPGGTIPEHDEVDRDQEEVFVVLSGSPSLVIDGEEHPAPAGTFARLAPEPVRTVANHGDEPASVLIVSAPRTSGCEPMGWA